MCGRWRRDSEFTIHDDELWRLPELARFSHARVACMKVASVMSCLRACDAKRRHVQTVVVKEHDG